MSRCRSPRPSITFSAFVLAALCLMAAPSGASIFEYDLRAYDGTNLICGGSLAQETDSVPVSNSVTNQINDTVGNSTGTYEAIAGRGIVGMRMAVSHRVNPGFNRLFGSCSMVSETIDDIVLTGPAGMINAELNAQLEGSLDVDSLSTRSGLAITVTLKSLMAGGAVRDESSTTIQIDVVESADLSQVISSGSVSTMVGDFLVAELRIDMDMVAGQIPDGLPNLNTFDILDETSGFGLHFSKTEALTLPAGYSSHSVQGDIGGNQWQGAVPVAQHTWGQLKSLYR